MNTIEYLIKKLEDFGITDYFGVPGDYNSNILDAIVNNQNSRWIGCTNELNAGYAADGYARQKGFGALVTSFGVGELSAINAIAGSYAENVPVINIVGVPSAEILNGKQIYHHNFQEPNRFAFVDAYKTVTETTAFLNKDNAKMEIDRVLRAFERERKPVYIAIPEDIAISEFSFKDVDYNWLSDTGNLEIVTNLITEKIHNSQKPVIIGDVLIKRYDAKNEFSEFVRKSGIPVTNFLMGANIINMDTENYLGTYLSKYGNPQAKEYLDGTDCLIAVGVIYGDKNSFGTPVPHKINSDIAIYGTYTYVEGKKYENIKMSDILHEISKKINHKKYGNDKFSGGYNPSCTQKEKLNSNYIYSRLQEFFKGDDIIFAESGTVSDGFAPMKLPENCEFHNQLLWSSSGWATPASFGASIANPKTRTVLVTGDCAHQMSAMEIGSMCRYGIKPVIIVINNSGYQTEKDFSDEFNKEYTGRSDIEFAKFARAFKADVWSTKVATDDDFDKALRVTQIMDKLCYIEAIVDKSDSPDFSNQMSTQDKSQDKPPVSSAKIKQKDKNISKRNVSDSKNYATNIHTSLKEYEGE